MNDEQVRIFLQVAECGSFTKAEADSYISKQAMLKQINNLESEVGCKLLTRSRSGTGLTAAGKHFYQGIQQLYTQREQLYADCRSLAGEQPTIRIGTVEHQVILSPVNALFSKKYPDIHLEHVIHPNHSGEWRVANDIQDVAETSADYGDKDLSQTYTPLVRTNYVAAMRKTHPLSGRHILTLEELTAYPTMCFIMLGQERIADLKEVFQQHPTHLIIRSDVDNQVGAAYDCISSDTILLSANPFVHSISELTKIPLAVDWSREYGIIYREPVTLPVRKYIDLAIWYYQHHKENINP